MALSPVRKQGVSAAALAAEQSKIYAAQTSTKQRSRSYIDEVLKDRLGRELAQRNKVVAQTEQEFSQVASENTATLNQLDSADEDAFYSLKAFFDPDLKSKDELEEIRRAQTGRMAVIDDKRRLADANYQRSFAEASLGGQVLTRESTLLQTQLKAIDENMEVQKGLLMLEANEYETDMAQYDLEGLLKLKAMGGKAGIPPGILERGIKDREQLELVLRASKDKSIAPAALQALRKNTADGFMRSEPIEVLRTALKAAQKSTTGTAPLSLPGFPQVEFTAGEYQLMVEDKEAILMELQQNEFESLLAVRRLGVARQSAIQTSGRLGLAPNSNLIREVEKLDAVNAYVTSKTQRVDEVTGEITNDYASLPKYVRDSVSAGMNELQTSLDAEIETQVKLWPKEEQSLRRAYLTNGYIPRESITNKIDALSIPAGDSTLLATRPKLYKAAVQYLDNLNLNDSVGAKDAAKSRGLSLDLFGGKSPLSKSKEQIDFKQQVLAASTAKPGIEDATLDKSPVDWVQEDLLSGYVDFIAAKLDLKKALPTLWGVDGKGTFSNGADFVTKMFLGDMQNRTESSNLGAFYKALHKGENLAAFADEYMNDAGTQFSTALVIGAVTDNNVIGFLKAATAEQFNPGIAVKELEALREDYEKITGAKSELLLRPVDAVISLFTTDYGINNADMFLTQKDMFDPTFKSAAESLKAIFNVEIKEVE